MMKNGMKRHSCKQVGRFSYVEGQFIDRQNLCRSERNGSSARRIAQHKEGFQMSASYKSEETTLVVKYFSI